MNFWVLTKRNDPILYHPAKQITQTNVPLAEQTRIQKVSPCGTTQLTPAKRTNPLSTPENGEAPGDGLPQINGERSTGSLFIHAQRLPHQYSMSEALECQWASPAHVAPPALRYATAAFFSTLSQSYFSSREAALFRSSAV